MKLNSKILSLTGLATTSELTVVENKIPSISNLIKKTDYNTKVLKLKRNLLIIFMIIALLLLNLIN